MNNSITHESGLAAPLPIKLLDETAVCEMLNLSPRHLRGLRERRLIPFVKLGRLVRFNPKSLLPAIDKLTIRARA